MNDRKKILIYINEIQDGCPRHRHNMDTEVLLHIAIAEMKYPGNHIKCQLGYTGDGLARCIKTLIITIQ